MSTKQFSSTFSVGDLLVTDIPFYRFVSVVLRVDEKRYYLFVLNKLEFDDDACFVCVDSAYLFTCQKNSSFVLYTRQINDYMAEGCPFKHNQEYITAGEET